MDSNPPDANAGLTALSALRRFARPRPARERCGLCGVDLPEQHDHLVELATQRLVCACGACAILFSGQGTWKHRRVPRRAEYLPDALALDHRPVFQRDLPGRRRCGWVHRFHIQLPAIAA